MKKSLFITIFCFATIVNAYVNKPVMVHLNLLQQSDTFGFNMVKDLQSTFYRLILDNKVKLWDGPSKLKQISPQSLQNIEKTTKTQFERSYDVFFHEIWTSNYHGTSFTILGISFMNQLSAKHTPDPTKDPIYGYIDLFECASVLNNNFCELNVNGPHVLSIFNALYSRKYNFNVVQFGKKDFKNNLEESLKVKAKAFYSKRKVEGIYRFPTTKEVVYYIEPDKSDAAEIGSVLYSNIQQYLNANREVVWNNGGDKYFDYLNYKSDFVVTRIELEEIWEKSGRNVAYHIQHIIIYVNNKKLDPITLEAISNWDLLYNFKTIEDVLGEKKFKYFLLTLNGNYLSEDESNRYIKGLHLPQIPWNQIKQYIKQ